MRADRKAFTDDREPLTLTDARRGPQPRQLLATLSTLRRLRGAYDDDPAGSSLPSAESTSRSSRPSAVQDDHDRAPPPPAPGPP